MDKSPCTPSGSGYSSSGSNSETETASRKKKQPPPPPPIRQRRYGQKPKEPTTAESSPKSATRSSTKTSTVESAHSTHSSVQQPMVQRNRKPPTVHRSYHLDRQRLMEQHKMQEQKRFTAELLSANQPIRSSTSSTTRSPPARSPESSALMSTQSSMSRSVLSESTQDEPASSLGRDVEVNSAAIHQLQQFARSVVARPMHEIVEEYKKIKSVLPYDFQCQAHKRNKKKSRYPDIFCIDKTRVILKEDDNSPREAGDFIHANYVNSDDLRKCYILTQGPKKETIADFWHMVWQMRCPIIIMLCDYSEDGKSKCAHYLPHRNTAVKIGDFIIRNSGRLLHAHGKLIETRVMLRRVNSSAKPLNLKHWRWTAWPDHKIPNDYQALFRLLRECRHSEGGFPIIHCSAGVGRSGTFIALEVCLSVLRNGKELNVKHCVELVRRQRAQSVQTVSQYIFLILALLEMAATNDLIDEKEVQDFRLAADKVCGRNKKIFGIGKSLI